MQDDAGHDAPEIASPPAGETSTEKSNPEVEATLDGGVEVTSGFPFGSLFFGFIFVAGCAALFIKFNGLQRISKALGIGKHRYRKMDDMDLED